MTCSCNCCRSRAQKQLHKRMLVKNHPEYQNLIIPLGELRGLIYRATRFPDNEPKNYVHFFKNQYPSLVTNNQGTRLYINGGEYRVTTKGIQG